MRKSRHVVTFFALLAVCSLHADEAGPDSVNAEFSQGITLDAATSREAQLSYSAAWHIGLGGEGVLTHDNSVDIELRGTVSPVSGSSGVHVVLTPLSVLQLQAGSTIGSGWYLAPLDVNGLGVLENQHENRYSQNAFDGFVWEASAGGALQFDTAAIIPGMWSSVLMRSYHGVEWDFYSRANGEPWEYRGAQDRVNGWSYTTESILAYQLPAFPMLRLVGVLYETETLLSMRNSARVAEGAWGSDFVAIDVAGLAVFDVAPRHTLVCLLQWSRNQNWINEETGLTLRELNPDTPGEWEFWRVALSYSYAF